MSSRCESGRLFRPVVAAILMAPLLLLGWSCSAAAQPAACATDNGGITLSPVFARPFSPTISAMSVTSPWRRTG